MQIFLFLTPRNDSQTNLQKTRSTEIDMEITIGGEQDRKI
jgi:hypothetical protein